MPIGFSPTSLGGGGRGVSEDGYSGASKFYSNVKTLFCSGVEAAQAAPALAGAAGGASGGFEKSLHTSMAHAPIVDSFAKAGDHFPKVDLNDVSSSIGSHTAGVGADKALMLKQPAMAGADLGSSLLKPDAGLGAAMHKSIDGLVGLSSQLGNPMGFLQMIFEFLRELFNPANCANFLQQPGFLHDMAGAAEQAALDPLKRLDS